GSWPRGAPWPGRPSRPGRTAAVRPRRAPGSRAVSAPAARRRDAVRGRREDRLRGVPAAVGGRPPVGLGRRAATGPLAVTAEPVRLDRLVDGQAPLPRGIPGVLLAGCLRAGGVRAGGLRGR